MNRGQTTIDFAIGVSIFILVIVFTFTFVPNALQPFEESAQQETGIANRVATQLVSDILANPENPYVLDRACTVAFFAPENTDDDGTLSSTYPIPSRCSYQNVDAIGPRLALRFDNIQVRLVRDLTTAMADDPDGDRGGDDNVAAPLCLDANDDRIVEANDPGPGRQCDPTSGDDDVLFVAGDDPPDTVSVVSASRVVEFPGGFADGTSDATLVVEVW